jgi:multisubunit Na+/H+ antiporter MnhF subunit
VNPWEIAATALGLALIGCALVAILAGPAHGLAAIEVASVLLTTILMLLAEGFHRQPFIDLAVVFAVMGTIGSFTFARLMERQL